MSPPNQGQPLFDTTLFLQDNTVETTLSQPFQSALPSVNSNGTQHKASASASPSLPHHNSHPASPTTVTSDSNGYYATANFLDPRSSHSPNTSGYSGNTTPGYDALDDIDLPPDADPILYDMETVPSVNLPEEPSSLMPRNSTGSSGYPPSPRLTVSPRLNSYPFGSPQNNSMHSSPLVKIERSTPEPGMGYPHPSPYSHQRSNSSASSGTGGGNMTIRRDEDGNWRGLGPSDRGDDFLPFTLKEQEFERKKQEKNAEVEEWLQRSAEQLPRQLPPNSNGGLAAPAMGRRRARSLADFRASQAFVDGKPVGPGESSRGNTTGVLVDEDENYYYDDDDSSVQSGFREGSLDDPADRPPTEDELKQAELEEQEREQKERERDPNNLPNPGQFFSKHPWNDLVAPVTRGATMMRNQPNTANAAVQKFIRCAENIETASRVATFGSNMTKGRRNSASDAEKVLGGKLIKQLSFGRDKDKNKSGPSPTRKPSIWRGFGLKRSYSNSGDKSKDNTITNINIADSGRMRGDSFNSGTSSQSIFAPSRLVGSPFGGTGSGLKVKTTHSALAGMVSPLVATGQAGGSHANTSPQINRSTLSGVIGAVKRSRSKSELHKQHIFGVVSSLVGPALPSPSPMTSPTPGPAAHARGSETEPARVLEKKFTFGEDSQKRGVAGARKLLSPYDAHRNEDGIDDIDDDLSPHGSHTPGGTKTEPPKLEIIPTLDGFAQNVRQVTPRLSSKLVDRVAHEQSKRFKKLVDHRQKHLAALKANGQCTNGSKCRKVIGAIGVGSDGVVGITGHKRPNGSFDEDNDFDSAGENEDGSQSPGDGNVAAAQFPPGVPTPPVSRLPAEFECPICFKTKKFNKPSDWTKHVHEDVQPFTCTFPDCTEPKSFKRKADWVRHENERHRHLEWWTCNQPDCSHTCYRKDNFVQHLVREHKMAEPKVKAQKSKKGSEAAGTQAEINKVWEIVEGCHQETDQHPSSEKCRFCGNACSTWKKLTVHLARHMETISLPVLDLIKDDAVVPQSSRGPRRAAATSQQKAAQAPPVQQHGPGVLSSTMDIDNTNGLSSQSHTSPDGEYETDDPMPIAPYQQQRNPVQAAPTYNLSPPQQHQRSRSVPSHVPTLNPGYLQQTPGVVNGPPVTTRPMPYQPTLSTGYHYNGVNEYNADRQPAVYNNQPLHDQVLEPFPSYFYPVSASQQVPNYSMVATHSMNAVDNRGQVNGHGQMGQYLVSQGDAELESYQL
ncbi:hypothetical protein EDC01DRAFT_629404 [Geopyxis carbonaria]|nr:hypothetical protein EDC01DRAFT_629404 [Geopyxis carbonaria]